MIRLADEASYPKLVKACSVNAVYGNLILVAWECCRDDWRFCNVWLGENEDGQPLYALCRTGNHYRFAGRADEGIDIKELADFFALQQAGEIQGDFTVMEQLNRCLCKTPYSSVTMAYTGGLVDYEPAFANIRLCESLYRLYDMVAASYSYFRDHVEREGWLSTLFAHKRKGCVYVYELVQDEKVVCSGVLTIAKDSGEATLGTIATLPEYQGRGFASTMVRYLCREAQQHGRTISLDCGDEGLVQFYTRLGLEVVGRWTALE